MKPILERIRIFSGLSESASAWMPVIVALFAIALCARLATLGAFLAFDPGFIYDDDSPGYVTLAANMESGNGFTSDPVPPFTPNSFRTPGYPLFLELHHMLFHSFLPALITQILLSLLIAYLTVLIADRYLRIEIGIIAAAAFLFMPFSLLVTVRYLTQVTFTATIMLATWFWLEYLSKGYEKYLFLAALFLPVAALIRPIAIVIFVPLIASLILAWLWKKIDWRRMLAASIFITVVFVAGIAPWLFHNYKIFGTPSLSSLPAFQLYFYDDPAIYAQAHGLTFDEAKKELNARIEKITGLPLNTYNKLYTEFSEITPALTKEGIKVAFEDPVALAITRLEEFGKFFVRDGIRYWIERYGIDTANGYGFILVVIERLVLAVFTVGFFFAAIRAFLRKDSTAFFMVLIVLYFAILTGVMASAGLRYPAEALFLLLGTLGLFEIYAIIKTNFPTKA